MDGWKVVGIEVTVFFLVEEEKKKKKRKKQKKRSVHRGSNLY